MPKPIERAAYYRECAARVRTYVDHGLKGGLRDALLEIARQYDELADRFETGRIDWAV